MSLNEKTKFILQQARSIAENASSWADFSNELFDPNRGLVSQAFPEEMQRQAFYDSPEYQEIQGILANLMRKFGVAAGASPTLKSGKFVVRIPKTLHQVLEIEARREGVSLNQLATCKLSLPISNTEGLKQDVVIDAFNAVHDGYSPDWTIVEPQCNQRFLSKCRQLGLTHSEWVLNHTLMNARKNPANKGKINKTTKRSGFSDYDEFAYASEISVRTLQRTAGVTLDRILCDPLLRAEFDRFAQQLSPVKDVVMLRCAAFNLRKTHRLQPIHGSVTGYDLVSAGAIKTVDLSRIASLPGTYVFYDLNRPIFAGETENLKKRIGTHLGLGLPQWLEMDRNENFLLKTLVLPSAKREDRLKWLGAFINSERPLLNYQKAA